MRLMRATFMQDKLKWKIHAKCRYRILDTGFDQVKMLTHWIAALYEENEFRAYILFMYKTFAMNEIIMQ